jgi:hypothetical protein
MPSVPFVLTVDSPQPTEEALAGLLIQPSTIATSISSSEAEGLPTTYPYHGLTTNYLHAQRDEQPQQGLGIMERYFAEGLAEQCWAFANGDGGQSSLHKGCACETLAAELVFGDEERQLGHDVDLEMAAQVASLGVPGEPSLLDSGHQQNED